MNTLSSYHSVYSCIFPVDGSIYLSSPRMQGYPLKPDGIQHLSVVVDPVAFLYDVATGKVSELVLVYVIPSIVYLSRLQIDPSHHVISLKEIKSQLSQIPLTDLEIHLNRASDLITAANRDDSDCKTTTEDSESSQYVVSIRHRLEKMVEMHFTLLSFIDAMVRLSVYAV